MHAKFDTYKRLEALLALALARASAASQLVFGPWLLANPSGAFTIGAAGPFQNVRKVQANPSTGPIAITLDGSVAKPNTIVVVADFQGLIGAPNSVTVTAPAGSTIGDYATLAYLQTATLNKPGAIAAWQFVARDVTGFPLNKFVPLWRY